MIHLSPIEKLQSAPYGILRTSDLTAFHVIRLHMEHITYQSLVQALMEMAQHGLYPQYAFMTQSIIGRLHAEQAMLHGDVANQDVVGISDGHGAHTTQFVALPGLDEYAVLFGFFDVTSYPRGPVN